MGKYQEAVVTQASRYVAVVYAVIDVLETRVAEEYDLDEILVDERDLDYGSIPSEGLVRVRLYNMDWNDVIDERVIEDAGLRVEIASAGAGYSGLGYRDLFGMAARAPFRYDSPRVRSFAMETSRSGIEYMLLYTDRGIVLMLEGEYLRVRIPRVKTILSIHTHPEGACGLSKADIETGLDLLSEGGVMEAAATPSCAFIMMREGAVSEDAYIGVKMLKGPLYNEYSIDGLRFFKIYY